MVLFNTYIAVIFIELYKITGLWFIFYVLHYISLVILTFILYEHDHYIFPDLNEYERKVEILFVDMCLCLSSM